MFVILFNCLNLILLNYFNQVAGQPNAPNAFLPVLDAIPTPLLQDLPGSIGQYGMAFSGQFGQRFPPHDLQQIEPGYQPLVEQHNQIQSQLQLNQHLNDHHIRHRNNLKKMFENQRQTNQQTQQDHYNQNSNHLIIDNLNDQNQYEHHKKTNEKEEQLSDPLEALIPQSPKLSKYDKNDGIGDIPDPLDKDTPLGAMVSKMEEQLAKEEEDKKKKDKDPKEQDGEQDDNQDKEQDEKTDLQQENIEPHIDPEDDDNVNLFFPVDEKEKKQPNDDTADDFKTYRTMKNANDKMLRKPQSSSTQQNLKSNDDSRAKVNHNNKKMNKRLSTINTQQKSNPNLHHRLRDKSNKQKLSPKPNQKLSNSKPLTPKLSATITNQTNQKVNRIVNQKLNPIGSRKQKLLQRNLDSATEKPVTTSNRQQQTLKATRKIKQQTSISQKSADITRLPVESPNLTSTNKLTTISKDQVKNAKNLTEVESKTLERLQLDDEVDPDLIVKEFDSSYITKSHDASGIDEFPSYNQLINNFENAELNTQEKFWSLDLEEIDPYKKVDISSYFVNKDKQEGNQQQEEVLNNKNKKDQQVADDQVPKNSEKSHFKNDTPKQIRKNKEKITTKTTSTTQSPEPEIITQQEEQSQLVKNDKDENLEGIEMQQYIEDGSPPENNNNLNENEENVKIENDSSESSTDNGNENVLGRKFDIKHAIAAKTTRTAITNNKIIGQSLIFDSKRLKSKKLKT